MADIFQATIRASFTSTVIVGNLMFNDQESGFPQPESGKSQCTDGAVELPALPSPESHVGVGKPE